MPSTYDELGNYGVQYKRIDVENAFHLPIKTAATDDSVNTDNGALVYVDGTGAEDAGIYAKVSGAYELISGNHGNFYANGGSAFGANSTLGITDNYRLDIITNNVSRLSFFPNGNIGTTTTDAGYKFQVDGSIYNTSTLTLGGTTNHLQIYTLTANPSIYIGQTLGSPPSSGRDFYKIGKSLLTTDSGFYKFLFGNTITDNSGKSRIISIGVSNTITNCDGNFTQIGTSNVANFTYGNVSVGNFQIGDANTMLHGGCAMFGANNTTTASNQLIFAMSRSNTNLLGFNDVYFGTGVRSGAQLLEGSNVTINSSGAGVGTNITGGNLTIAGGKNTGNNDTGGNVYIATPTAGSSGTTLQSLTNRVTVKANTGHVILNNVAEYADNAAASGAGLAVGTIYRTGDILKIVH